MVEIKRLIFRLLTLMMLMGAGKGVQAQVLQFPFEMKDNYMLIKATVNSKDSITFIFDTGATGTVIGAASTGKAGLDMSKAQSSSIAGLGGANNGTVVTGQKIGLPGGLKLKDVNVFVMDLTPFRQMTGLPIEGFIGFDIMKSYIVSIDYEQHKINLYNKISALDTTGYAAIDVELIPELPIPTFPVTIKLENGERFTGKVLFDSGFNSSLLISAPFNRFHNISNKIGKTTNTAIGGVVATGGGTFATISSLRFGPFRFADLKVMLPSSENVSPKDGELGILGAEIIMNFHVIMDYANKKIYLKPKNK